MVKGVKWPVVEGMKYCPTCERHRSVECFYKAKRDGLFTYCKDCTKARNAARSPATRRKWHLKQTYGLSERDFDLMFKAQRGVCAICPDKLVEGTGGMAVDHCHSSGRVRGLLCGRCNQMIGFARDNIAILDNAIVYLSKPQDTNFHPY